MRVRGDTDDQDFTRAPIEIPDNETSRRMNASQTPFLSSLLVSEARFQRQLGIVSPEQLAFPIVVIGAGAIGSATVVTLAKMGCADITVWDDDTLEEHNIPNQLCKPSMVGQPKVEALRELTLELMELAVKAENRRYRGQKLRGLVVAAVDSMDARQVIWKRVKLDADVPLLIDARMGAEFARLYAVHPCDPDETDFYESNLYSSAQAERLPCSARSIIYCPTVVAGLVALFIKQHAISKSFARELLLDLRSLRPYLNPSAT
jgi:hypothetical protein